ncbi:chlorohydrolase [Streptococcus pneumoniae]|uniref:Chlorohydrolase n=1 Tax=Streptococcus pneumoniae TaxID=1313 RepID=A0A4J2BNW3_STREE|nr:chlorohydrolase [Streptococcus pneumoniae]VNC78241.1 chlorohydrolase [Streptococcus pneumoniae]VNJ55891.1 chlorohydrolase [Streptococcus pneumoniae]VNJ83678.1 chlorohydrolase [Streptococcus pneumoniae]VNK18014.1 chlorohydrolase [Streptococcus pneumoniae]
MKIKEQTRKLAAGCSKSCFEVVDRTDEVSNHTYGKATLTWFEEIFEEYQFVKIGDEKYRVRSVPMIHSTPPQSVLDRDTFTIDYTDDELLDKEAVFTTH